MRASRPAERVEEETGGLPGCGIDLGSVVAAVFPQLNASGTGAQEDVEAVPMTGFMQRGRHAANGVAEEWHGGQTGEIGRAHV